MPIGQTTQSFLTTSAEGLTLSQRMVKRGFDIIASILGLLVLWPVILVGWIAATISTGANGFFVQLRIGRYGKLIPVIKLRSMRPIPGVDSSVTSDQDIRVTRIGRWLRKSKLDELPQLINVLVGQMSLVGPRPDVPGFADKLRGDDRIILSVRPGITGPATLAFREEEDILARVDDPETYNREIIWPEKVRLNRQYIAHYSFTADLNAIWQTVTGR